MIWDEELHAAQQLRIFCHFDDLVSFRIVEPHGLLSEQSLHDSIWQIGNTAAQPLQRCTARTSKVVGEVPGWWASCKPVCQVRFARTARRRPVGASESSGNHTGGEAVHCFSHLSKIAASSQKADIFSFMAVFTL